MRLNRLDLTRYGIFTDYNLPFGDNPPDGPDLHIIYGPNEAGKSTIFAGFMDLVFGIGARSKYGFLHDYKVMRIGGQLEIDGDTKEFIRVKRNKGSLLDASERAIPDSAILGHLGGLGRDTYATMFSLDDDTLEAGGESILASQGDLGQLLFSASAGLSHLSDSLQRVREEADAFYRFRVHNTALAGLKRQMDILKQRQGELDTLASEYAKLSTAKDRAQEQYETASAERAETQTDIDRLQRQLMLYPKLTALRDLQSRIEALSDIPSAPQTWATELPALLKEDVELTTRESAIQGQVDAIREEINSITVDHSVLAVADRVGLLRELSARYTTAAKDIPVREAELRDTDVEMEGILSRIECTGRDPAGLLLGASVTGGLRDLMESRSGLQATVDSTKRVLSDAQERRDQIKQRLEAAGDKQLPAAVMTALAAALSQAQHSGHAASKRIAERAMMEASAELQDQLQGLAPWSGEADTLRGLTVPNKAEIRQRRETVAELDTQLTSQETEIARLSRERAELEIDIAAVKDKGVVSDHEAAAVRAAREAAWAEHRQSLNPATADAFETCLRRDDLVVNERTNHVADLAEVNQLNKRYRHVCSELENATAQREAATQTRADLQVVHQASIRDIDASLPDNWGFDRLLDWLELRDAALETMASLASSGRDRDAAIADGDEVRNKLVAPLKAGEIAHEPEAPLDTLIALGQATVSQESGHQTLRDALASSERDVASVEKQVEEAEAALQGWAESWATRCGNCWLGEVYTDPGIETVREALSALESLAPLVGKHTGLQERIEQMQADQQQFESNAAALAATLDRPIGDSPLDFSTWAAQALTQAQSAKHDLEAATQRLEGAEARFNAIREQITVHDRTKSRMLTHFSVKTLEDVSENLRNLEKRGNLESQACAAEQEIISGLLVPTLEEAEAQLDALDPAEAERRIAEVKNRHADQDRRIQQLFSELSTATDRLEAVGGDDEVARIAEQRRTLLLEIEDGAMRYLRLKLGVTAADEALRLYRDQHRSSMMVRASEAFKVISRGAYTGLTTQPVHGGEVLVAVGASEGAKMAADLSKGTRFQLYLALRVAGYLEFVSSHRPVPFIADDIMETFDDDRSEEAFRLFAEMAKEGQVIYLTHHKHLCEIALKACPDAKIHHLEEAK